LCSETILWCAVIGRSDMEYFVVVVETVQQFLARTSMLSITRSRFRALNTNTNTSHVNILPKTTVITKSAAIQDKAVEDKTQVLTSNNETWLRLMLIICNK